MKDSNRRRLGFASYVAGGLSLALAFLSSTASADVQGEIVGHAHTLEASLLGAPVLDVNSIDLPPDASLGVNLSADAVGVLVLNSSTAATDCSGVDSGPEVVAKCVSTVEDLEISVTGLGSLADFVLIEATTLRAVSKSSDDGTTAQSLNNDPDTGEATQIVGLCIATNLAQVLAGTCTAVNTAGTVNISIDVLGVPLLAGTVTVWDESTRTTDGSLTGTGLTVTMLLVELTVLGTDTVELSLVQADSFVGDVVDIRTETPTPVPTDTAVPGATDTPTPAPTNTPVPGATDTPIPTATNTAAPTNTPIPGATNTPVPTDTAIPTNTPTQVASAATNTPQPAATSTNTPQATATATRTATPTATSTATPSLATVIDPPDSDSTSLPPAAPVSVPAVPAAPAAPAQPAPVAFQPPSAGDGGLAGVRSTARGMAFIAGSVFFVLGGLLTAGKKERPA